MKTVDLVFYMDGAFFGKNAGPPVVVTNREGLIIEEEAIYLGQNCSAYQAEILAIKSAAEHSSGGLNIELFCFFCLSAKSPWHSGSPRYAPLVDTDC